MCRQHLTVYLSVYYVSSTFNRLFKRLFNLLVIKYPLNEYRELSTPFE
jgi:hypothetical protein